MKVLLMTVPVEVFARSSYEKSSLGVEVFTTASRAGGSLPVMPKIAIVNLVKTMLASGHRRENIDFYDVDMLLPTDEEIEAFLLKSKPTVIGLSAVVSTCYSQVKRLAQLVKRVLPGTLVVMGGSLSASANLVLRKTQVDVCVVGDGEIAWVDLLKAHESEGFRSGPENWSAITGLSFLRSGKLEFTGYGKSIAGAENYYPDYDILESGLDGRPELLRNYFRLGMGTLYVSCDSRSKLQSESRPWLAQVWTTKGCVARCTFCQRSTKGYRVFDSTKLDAHLKEIRTRFNVGFVHVIDENFGSDKKYTMEIAKVFRRNQMLWFAAGIRVSSVDEEYIQFLKDHGCTALKFGVESGSSIIMDVMEKKFTTKTVYDALKYCADREVYSPLAIMVGMPGETLATATETGKFVGKLSHMQGINPRHGGVAIFYALPLTGTPLYVYGQQKGVLGTSPDEEESYMMSVSSTGADKLNYINLNGSSFRDVIWWDYLVRFESLKEFFRLSKANPLPKNRPHYARVIDEHWVAGLSGFQKIKMTLKDLLYSKWVFGTPLVKVIQPLTRIAVTIRFVYLRYYFKIRRIEYNLFKKWPHIDQLDSSTNESSKPTRGSLRTIVIRKAAANVDLDSSVAVQNQLSIGL